MQTKPTYEETVMMIDECWPHSNMSEYVCCNCGDQIMKGSTEARIDAEDNAFCCLECALEYYNIKEIIW